MDINKQMYEVMNNLKIKDWGSIAEPTKIITSFFMLNGENINIQLEEYRYINPMQILLKLENEVRKQVLRADKKKIKSTINNFQDLIESLEKRIDSIDSEIDSETKSDIEMIDRIFLYSDDDELKLQAGKYMMDVLFGKDQES